MIVSSSPSTRVARSGRFSLAGPRHERTWRFAAGGPHDERYYEALADFDFWLRADGHRRNPGATADLIAAALFAGLRDHRLTPPFQ